mmetsp:Transcript_17786/g.56867  ORF Transcript_17786/g.56867 Transcript_17786/m.56867 type:complete len:206 (+) Transcript_17786:788-1405(+)
MATSAWPPSWYAVTSRTSSGIIADLRSAPMRILSLAYSRSSRPIRSLSVVDARRAAMLTRFARSAPEAPGVPRAITSTSTSVASGILFRYSSRMALRSCRSGSGTTRLRSNLPGRTSAGSSSSGKLVAPTMITPSVSLKPSSSTRSWLSVILSACCSLSARVDPIASISSMKTMHGAASLAASKRSRTRRAPTPTYISSNSEPDA